MSALKLMHSTIFWPDKFTFSSRATDAALLKIWASYFAHPYASHTVTG